MRALYKKFVLFPTVFFVFFALCPVQTGAQPRSDESLFTVRDIEVDVTAKSAAIAQEEAFAQAQLKAFQVLSARMLSEQAAKGFMMPAPDVIAGLIQDFEITKERTSAVRYVGTYIFRFKDREVRNFFAGIGMSFTDVTSRPVLILPFYQVGESTVLWSPYNIWLRAWRNSGDQVGIVPMVVPVGDAEDMGDIGDNEALSYDEIRLSAMAERYGAGESVLMIAVPDVSLLDIPRLEDPAIGYLSVYIYRTDRKGPEFVQRVTLAAEAGQTKEGLFQAAVGEVQNVLKKNWKDRTSVDPNEANRLPVIVHFSSFEEWAETQSALEDVYGVDEVVLKNLSSEKALVELVFQGSERRLRLALAQADLTLTSPRIDMAGLQQGGSSLPLVYELYLNRYSR